MLILSKTICMAKKRLYLRYQMPLKVCKGHVDVVLRNMVWQ